MKRPIPPPLPQVWSFNPIMQTKATIMSKSSLLSLEWATKPDRLVRNREKAPRELNIDILTDINQVSIHTLIKETITCK